MATISIGQAIIDVFTPGNTRYILTGIGITLLISVTVVLVSIFFGTLLALARNYEKRVLGKFASAYIEIFRNTPLLLWILVCVFLLPFGNAMLRGSLALTLYTSSVIAEIVRGGLNSIAKGQFEAGRSQGFNFLQILYIIALPQTFERIAPSLMSQVVTTIKDTSFLAQFAIAELFYRAKNVMSSLPQRVKVTSTHVFLIFIFVAVVYFIINFTLSCIVRAMRKRAVR
jgi:putative glutamine transport system permease protein